MVLNGREDVGMTYHVGVGKLIASTDHHEAVRLYPATFLLATVLLLLWLATGSASRSRPFTSG